MQLEHINLFHVKNNECFTEVSAQKYIWNRETEAERYFTSIACWQQILLGWLDKW